MRPPEFTGGNAGRSARTGDASGARFNEAAGIHRRKLAVRGARLVRVIHASMRPPEFTGGNPPGTAHRAGAGVTCFNEAAGIHRRKLATRRLTATDRYQLQ